MQIKFPMPDGPLPLWLQCDAVSINDEWVISGIELYRDDSYSLPSLVADDIDFASLPDASKTQLAEWIEREWQIQHHNRYFSRVHDLVMGSLEKAR